MKDFLLGFDKQHIAIMFAALMNAIAAVWLLYKFFNSRWWIEMVVDPITNRVVAGDLAKASCLVLGHMLTVAIAIAKLGYGKEPGVELIGLVGLLYGNSSYLQNVKRLLKKDITDAQNPTPKIEITDSKVSVGPNTSAAPAAAATPSESGPTFK